MRKQEAAEKAAKRAQLRAFLTPQPSDSPEVRASIEAAKQRQEQLAYNKQRVQVAQNIC